VGRTAVLLLTVLAQCFAPVGAEPSAAGAAGAQRRVVGYVESLGDAAEKVAILRRGQRMPARIWQELEEGDRIEILHEGAILVVSNIDGSRRAFGPEVGVSEALAPGGEAPSIWQNVWEQMAQRFANLRIGEATTVIMATRGDAIVPDPVFADAEARIASGNRPLCLAWSGGEPPYAVSIKSEDGRTLIRQKTEDEFVKTPAVDWRPGTYRIDLSDASQTTSFKIRVVDPASLPNTGLEGPDTSIREPLRILTQAYALASIEDGAWALEAYQRLCPLEAQAYAPAAILAESLRMGDFF